MRSTREKNGNDTTAFVGSLTACVKGLCNLNPLQVPSSSSNGTVPNPVFAPVPVQLPAQKSGTTFDLLVVAPPPVQLTVAWSVRVLPFAQRRPEPLAIPTLTGTKHDYHERAKMQIAYF